MRIRHHVLHVVLAAALCGCGASPASVPAGANAVIDAPHRVGASSSGNIYRNKRRVRLRYASQTHGSAILTYWGPNGYYTTPMTCKRGGRVVATTHHRSGNPSGYVNVVYWFKARSKGPDHCGFSAVLDGTGSPPIAPISIHIGHG